MIEATGSRIARLQWMSVGGWSALLRVVLVGIACYVGVVLFTLR